MITANLLALLLAVALMSPVHAGVIFSDDFEGGASPDWGNELGDWQSVGGTYFAQSPGSDPPAYTSVSTLPDLVDFAVEFDIVGVNDGGVFLRSRRCENGQVEGVLLIVGGYNGSYDGIYWHAWTCSGPGDVLGLTPVTSLQGTNAHIRVEVEGDNYRAYVNHSAEPNSTLTTSTYASGRVALYQFMGQSFDNVSIYCNDTLANDETRGTWSCIKALYR